MYIGDFHEIGKFYDRKSIKMTCHQSTLQLRFPLYIKNSVRPENETISQSVNEISARKNFVLHDDTYLSRGMDNPLRILVNPDPTI